MRKIYYLLASVILLSCNSGNNLDIEQSQIHIVPYPAAIDFAEGTSLIKANSSVSIPDQLTNLSKEFSAFYPKYAVNSKKKPSILFEISEDEMPLESYTLTVQDDQIIIKAAAQAGLFYGLQSLKQILPSSDVRVNYTLPNLSIIDQPRFSYRGMHLDVSRHMFSIEEIKKILDWMAFYKLNKFHWHLTDDQGWRIEIKQYPKLQEVAAYRSETLVGKYEDGPTFDGERYGGFYTQEQAKEIVKYAAERNIIVIPEIEIPGHAQAAIAAYPELGCTGEQIEPRTFWGVSEYIYCPSEETFEFLENVLAEIIAIFPSQYIHIGGDEAPKKQWEESALAQELIKKENLKDEHELQSYFIQRIEKYLNQFGRNIIGWDEILEGGLAPNATVMWWRGWLNGGTEAANQDHDVIMTPTNFCYFDFYQSKDPDEPLAIGGYLPIETVYSLNPIPEGLSPDKHHFIKGVQANVWSEYIPTNEQLEYMVFPRLLALSEVAWTPEEKKDYPRFLENAKAHVIRQQNEGLNPATHILEEETVKEEAH